MYQLLVTFVLVRIAISTPICANPLAAAAIPTPLPQRMFHVAMEKGLVPLVPLLPGQGVISTVDIIIVDLISSQINNHQKFQRTNLPC